MAGGSVNESWCESFSAVRRMDVKIHEMEREMRRIDQINSAKRNRIEVFRTEKFAAQRQKEFELRKDITKFEPFYVDSRERLEACCRVAARYRLERQGRDDRYGRLSALVDILQKYHEELQIAIESLRPDKDFLGSCCDIAGFNHLQDFIYYHESLSHVNKELHQRYDTATSGLEEQKRIHHETKKSYDELKVNSNNLMALMVQKLNDLENST